MDHSHRETFLNSNHFCSLFAEVAGGSGNGRAGCGSSRVARDAIHGREGIFDRHGAPHCVAAIDEEGVEVLV